MSNGRAIFRIERLANWSAVHRVGRHGRREEGWMPHIDPARTADNMILVGTDDPVADVRGLIDNAGARFRRGMTSPATHLLLTASPQYFRPDGGAWLPERVEAMQRTVLAFGRRWFPGMVAHVRQDMDEETPHWDMLVVPMNRWRTRSGREVVEVSHRSVFSRDLGRRAYAVWQDRWAEACADLGLERGRRGALAHHKRPAKWHTENYVELLSLREEVSALRAVAAEADRLREEAAQAPRLREALAAERRAREAAEAELVSLRAVAAEAEALRRAAKRREHEDEVVERAVAAMGYEPAAPVARAPARRDELPVERMAREWRERQRQASR